MADFKVALGDGIKIFLAIALGVMVGVTWMKAEQNESTTGVLSIDSEAGQKITDEDRRLKDEVDKWLETNDPVDSDGKPTREWLHYLESQRTTARERGDQGSVIRKITKMFTP